MKAGTYGGPGGAGPVPYGKFGGSGAWFSMLNTSTPNAATVGGLGAGGGGGASDGATATAGASGGGGMFVIYY